MPVSSPFDPTRGGSQANPNTFTWWVCTISYQNRVDYYIYCLFSRLLKKGTLEAKKIRSLGISIGFRLFSSPLVCITCARFGIAYMSKKVRMTTPKLMFMTLLIVVIMLTPIIGGLILSADTMMGDRIASAKNRHFPT